MSEILSAMAVSTGSATVKACSTAGTTVPSHTLDTVGFSCAAMGSTRAEEEAAS
jgi:hypothetical protein